MPDSNNTNEQYDESNLNEILKVRRDKLDELKKSGEDPFDNVKFDVDSSSIEIKNNFNEMEGNIVSIAGRIMQKRVMGKASFCNILDRHGSIQLYVRIDNLGEEPYKKFKKFDIGDFIGVAGEVFMTHKKEISVKALKITLLAKSLRPLPEKWHGLKDVDLRYRKRYLDLIVNPDVRDTFIKRSKIISSIRKFLDERGFLEVETPMLNTIPGGASARPFITHHNALDMDLYLRIAPELYLKRLITGGLERVYEMGRMFRNEGISIKHNPEFTMMEVYQAYTDYKGMMELCEQLIYNAAIEANGSAEIEYQGQKLNLNPPFKRLSMSDAVKEYAGIDFNGIPDAKEAVKAALERGVEIEGSPSKGEVMNTVFETLVEDKLMQPVFIYDYPVEVSPLTKRKPDVKELTERFEIFIMGREIGNAYSELNDPVDQNERFINQMEKRKAGDEEAQMIDNDFIDSLEYGMPPTGGLGIGIDRLIMLLTDSASIRDIILFPTMRIKE